MFRLTRAKSRQILLPRAVMPGTIFSAQYPMLVLLFGMERHAFEFETKVMQMGFFPRSDTPR
jgi:hypothetical protein